MASKKYILSLSLLSLALLLRIQEDVTLYVYSPLSLAIVVLAPFDLSTGLLDNEESPWLAMS